MKITKGFLSQRRETKPESPMRCPLDGTTLVIADRNGVEIDYCPQCRGVWLDRGELDKIIERATPAAAPTPHHRGSYKGGCKEGYRKKKRGGLGLLDDLFDF